MRLADKNIGVLLEIIVNESLKNAKAAILFWKIVTKIIIPDKIDVHLL